MPIATDSAANTSPANKPHSINTHTHSTQDRQTFCRPSPPIDAVCKICLEGGVEHSEVLIAPCLCSGSSKWIHRSCLDSWRASNIRNAFTHCSVCKFEYVIEWVKDEPREEARRLRHYRLLLTRDVVAFICVCVSIIVLLSYFIALLDSNHDLLRSSFYSNTPVAVVYSSVSVCVVLFLMGVFGLIAYCCGCVNGQRESSQCDCHNCCTHPHCLIIDGDCCSGCSGSTLIEGEGGAACAAVLVVFFIVIGIFVGIALTIQLFNQQSERHIKRLWLREEADKYAVKDFNGFEFELQQLSLERKEKQKECTIDVDDSSSDEETHSLTRPLQERM